MLDVKKMFSFLKKNVLNNKYVDKNASSIHDFMVAYQFGMLNTNISKLDA